MAKFKVGDRVKHIDGNYSGVIKELFCVANRCRYLVDYGVFNSWVPEIELEPVRESVCIPKPTWRIIIEGDENTSRAKYIMGKKGVKAVSAKRHPDDKHSVGVAAQVLVGRLFPDIKEPGDPPKYFTGRAVCVETNNPALTRGRIYDFSINDGLGKNDIGGTILCFRPKNVDAINEGLRLSKFIEIKED